MAETFPHTPQDRSGSARMSTRQQATAVTPGRNHRRSVTTAPAPASAYPGIASATHFCPSRRTPKPGAASTTARSACKPGPVASALGTSTDTAASASNPAATKPSSTTAENTAKRVAREAGTASPFQMPPRLARLASVPSPGSARGANASTPSAFAAVWAVNDDPNADAISQGSAATSAATSAAAAHSLRGLDPPGPSTGTATHTSATVAASNRPVGVSPASAIQNASSNQPVPLAVRSLSIAVATHGRQP